MPSNGRERRIREHPLVEECRPRRGSRRRRRPESATVASPPRATRPDSRPSSHPSTERPVPQVEDRASRGSGCRGLRPSTRLPASAIERAAHQRQQQPRRPPSRRAPATGTRASASGKYDRSRSSVAPAPGGNHWPTAPHGVGRNSTGVAAEASGTANRTSVTAPTARPGRPITDARPEHGARRSRTWRARPRPRSPGSGPAARRTSPAGCR